MQNFKIALGMCKGRHEMPVKDFIFGEEIDPTDVEGLYLTARKRLEELFPESEPAYVVTPVDNDEVRYYYAGEIVLYVTGLSVALVATLNACFVIGIKVTLMHYDREKGTYYEQSVKGLF